MIFNELIDVLYNASYQDDGHFTKYSFNDNINYSIEEFVENFF